MIELSPGERASLRARAHALRPVVSIGQQGLTPAVLHEIDVALAAHELVKIRVHDDDRDAREKLLGDICDALAAAPVQHLGRILIVHREKPEAPATRRRARAVPKPKTRGKSPHKPPQALVGRKGRDSSERTRAGPASKKSVARSEPALRRRRRSP